jgi:hypothetical protein
LGLVEGRTYRNIAARPAALAGVALAWLVTTACAAPPAAPLPGAVEQAPLTALLRTAVIDSVRAQLVAPEAADIRILVHFPSQRGDNGRVCGEVTEPGPPERKRAFFSIYTRAGRVLTRLEDEPFEQYLAADAVFRNCSPRL